jgi:ABC-type sugar transport system substrate-binding protein
VSARPADVTIKDVASLAGFSPMTVSRVINASDRVSPDTQRRVQEAIAELGYIPSRLARGLSARRTRTLAVIVPDVANPFFTMIVRAAEEVARRSSYRVILCDTRADLAVERDVIEELIAHRVEGIAIAPVSDRSKPHLARLARFGVPFVLIDRTVAGIDCDAVVGDSVGGAQRLVEHLIALGHRRIGLIVEKDEVSSARERRRRDESAGPAGTRPARDRRVDERVPGRAPSRRRHLRLRHQPGARHARGRARRTRARRVRPLRVRPSPLGLTGTGPRQRERRAVSPHKFRLSVSPQ